VRNRCPRRGHDAVTHDLVHRPFVAVHGVHHALQYRVDEVAGSSGSRSASNPMEPLRSANSTVACLYCHRYNLGSCGLLMMKRRGVYDATGGWYLL
jgi:hypothetical protein